MTKVKFIVSSFENIEGTLILDAFDTLLFIHKDITGLNERIISRK